MDYHIATLDIGKTNKKIVVFSNNLELISKESVQIGSTVIKNVLCDRITELNKWILNRLKVIAKKNKIGVISTTTYGATIACLDKKGALVFPVVSYMHEPGKQVNEKFFRRFGTQEELYTKTATPSFGQLLSVGKQIFWLKEKRIYDFKKVQHILFLPQYIGYILTGKRAIELTSIGCHTHLYDFKKKTWSNVAKALDVVKKFPEKFSNPWDLLGKINVDTQISTDLPEECKVSVGIHDSNSSLLPYLLAKKGEFILASTGTWGVFMFRGGEFYLSTEDLYKDTLYYLDAFGNPVRSARFAIGAEHDHYCKIIEKKFGVDPKKFHVDIKLIKEILTSNCFITPGIIPCSGQFPDSKPQIIDKKTFFKDVKTAYTIINTSLAIQSYFAIKQALGRKLNKNIPIYVEGGFHNNQIYLSILSTLFPEQQVVATNIQEATSLGAAICGKCTAEGIQPDEIDPRLIKISEKTIPKLNIDQKLIQQYTLEFVKHCTAS